MSGLFVDTRELPGEIKKTLLCHGNVHDIFCISRHPGEGFTLCTENGCEEYVRARRGQEVLREKAMVNRRNEYLSH